MLSLAGATSVAGTTQYGDVTIGQSKTNTLTLKNTSRTNIRLDSYWFSGSPDFTRVGGTCGYNSTSGWVLKAGKSCTVQIKFAPKYSGLTTAQFAVGYFLG